MENLVATTDVRFRAGAFFQEGPLIAGKMEHPLSRGNWIFRGSQSLMNLHCIGRNSDRDVREGLPDTANRRVLADCFINVKLGNHLF
jgi:hypothetical protein